MKKLTTILLLFIGIVTCKSQTIDVSIQENYPTSVVTRLYNLVAKTNISSNKQIAIADIFRAQDSAIALMIKNNETKRAIDSVSNIYQNSWKAVLSATDQFYYSTATASENKSLRYTYELLSLAIKNKEQLNLSTPLTDYLLSKIDSLKQQEDLFYQQNPNQVFNSYPLQNRYVNTVLSDDQYTKLMHIKGKDNAYTKAKTDWEALNTLKLADGLNVDSTLLQFVNFYLAKDFAYGRYQDNLPIRRKYLQAIYDTEPDAVRKLYYARKYKNTQANNKPTDFSQILFAIKNTDKLALSEEQTKNLFAKANELEKLKEESYRIDSTKPFDARAYECTNLKTILNGDQYNQFLILKNSGRAKNTANADWRELTQRNMIEGHSKDSTISVLSNYYLQRQSAYDRNEDNKVLQSEIIKELYANKPAPLNALIKARRSPGNNTQGQVYSW